MANKKPIRYCSVPHCERIHRANGFCASHDEQAKRGFTPVEQFKPFKWLDSVCGINGCPLPTYSRGACRTHYGICNSFSISLEDLQAIYDEPCGICGDTEATIHVDHDHKCCPTGGSCGTCIRGGLCGSCNMALGSFRDSPKLLLKALEYLSGRD